VSKTPIARMTGHQQLINQVLFSPDGRWILSASFDKSVKLWDGLTGMFVATMRAHVGPVYQVRKKVWRCVCRCLSSPKPYFLFFLSTVHLFLTPPHPIPPHLFPFLYTQVAWSADSRLAVSGSRDSTLKLWEVRTRKVLVDLPGHADEVFSVDWSPDGGSIALSCSLSFF
jgi:ribosome assembly protein 4